MPEALVFSQSFEALLRALGGQLTEESKTRFRQIGIDFDKRLLPAYPLAVWVAHYQDNYPRDLGGVFGRDDEIQLSDDTWEAVDKATPALDKRFAKWL